MSEKFYKTGKEICFPAINVYFWILLKACIYIRGQVINKIEIKKLYETGRRRKCNHKCTASEAITFFRGYFEYYIFF